MWRLGVDDENAIAIAKNLQFLISLDLYGNRIRVTGAQAIAEHLHQLTKLDLGSNRIGETGVQAIAEHLHRLTTLNLWGNGIGDTGAQAIAEHLHQLTTLDLSSNDVGDTGAQAIAEHLHQLTTLDLAHNNLGDETVAVIARNLTHLTVLNLEANRRITSVEPFESFQVGKLNLSGTNVTDLTPLRTHILAGVPVRWEEFTYESGILVYDCPLGRPSPEIVRQGPEAVLNFFRELDTQGVDHLFEAKLLIIGEGGAGKTSLLRRLFFPALDLPAPEETTRGIDIHPHPFPVGDGHTFRLNTWDFGGQQIYHATHQFFLTKRSLYVLVDDTRSNHRSVEDEGFKFWLEVVETLSEGSPLLIFQNERGGRSKPLDEAGIKGRFPNVKGIYGGDLEDPGAADGVRRAIEHFALQLPHVGDDVPAQWVQIRQELEAQARQHPTITQDAYFALYDRHLPPDRDKALHLSQYLHDLGIFLHFQKSRLLRRTLFLQNTWVTNAVFRILDDETIKKHQGRFRLEDCDRLWTDQGYADMEEELRALMVKFELIYQLPDVSEATWLVPQHLPPSRPPQLDTWARTGDLMLTYRYTFLPRGLVSRLIVRMHRYVKQPELCWSSGALFEHGTAAVLVQTESSRAITLRARGVERQALLSVLAADLDALNGSFSGLKVEKWVPCVCATCAELDAPMMFRQQELLERKKWGQETIECSKPPTFHGVSVRDLLEGMDLQRWRKEAEKTMPEETDDTATPEPGEKTIRIFLASSSELKGDRDAFELYFRQQNDRLRHDGLYLEIIRWENFLDAMSPTRLQDEYNKKIRNCDLFVSLFRTKTGKYTEEEFDKAHEAFSKTGKPLIYTYFHQTDVPNGRQYRVALNSLWDFQQKLDDLGHFHTEYTSIDDLQKQFRDQLEKLRDEGMI